MPTLALLDGHSLAYRAFYALPADLATPSGRVTNAVFGFTSMLIKLMDDEDPDVIAVAWDVSGPTFRKERYEEYKAQREAPPDLFRGQLPLIRDVLEAMKIPQLGVQGFEADDVIATLAQQAVESGWSVVVVTGDRDAFQLIRPGVEVLYTRRGISDTVKADAAYVEGRYGVPPERYVEYAALRGDTSDNLPGVPGVGEKTAAKLIGEYGSIDGVYEHLDEQTPKLKDNLAANRDQVYLNRELMDLVTNVPVAAGHERGDAGIPVAGPEDLRSEPWDPVEVREVFDDLAFRTLWERLMELEGTPERAAGGETVEVEVRSELDPDRIARLGSSGPLVLEPVWEDGELAGIAIVESPGERGAGDEGPTPVTFVPEGRLEHLGAALADEGVPKILHDAKPVMRELLGAGFDVRGLAFDTALAAYVVNPAQRAPDLEELALRELGITVEPAGSGEAVDDAQGTLDFEGSAGPDLDAAGRRAAAVARLVSPLREQLEGRGVDDLFRSVELPLVRVLAKMEMTGIAVDREYLERLGDDLRGRLAKLEQAIHGDAGEPFNVNSTLQLREVLFGRLDLPVLKKTPKGQPSTDASVLQKLAEGHPIVARLLEYRELEKLRSTYVDALIPLIEEDSRIRGRFNQMAAATGRLSSDQPNLQNIPIRSEEGRAIRYAFVAPPGRSFIVADYSQIELRILAHLSKDAGLLDAFRHGADVHTATAARVFGVDAGEVAVDQRRMAKVINFGLLYGMEAYGLAQRLEIDTDEAADHIEAYFEQFPEVRAFMSGIVDDAKASGYTTTLLGRRRYLPELASRDFRARQGAERMALNAPIQGSAADIIKKAMIELDGALESEGTDADMLLQIHDELVLEAAEDAVDHVADLTRSVMEGIVELEVPLAVDVAVGPSLGACKE